MEIDRLYFFQVPIYRCTFDKFRNETLNKIKKRKEYLEDRWKWQKESPKMLSISRKAVFPAVERRAFEKPWKYNEIIGWIELYIWSGQIRGDLYYIKKIERVKRFGKKEYYYLSKTFEMNIFSNETSKQIFTRLLTTLNSHFNEIFKNRYLDLDILKNAGKNINWKKLVQFGK